MLRKNGSVTRQIYNNVFPSAVAAGDVTVDCSVQDYGVPGDYYELLINNNSSAALKVESGDAGYQAYWEGFRLP
jgi:hypothetical protein